MKEIHEYEKDLSTIRTMMERSAKFISLSGLSGVLAGIYALAGAAAAYSMIHYPESPFSYRLYSVTSEELTNLFVIAAAVLVASLATCAWLSSRKAKRSGSTIWNTTTKRVVINMVVPLITGGLFIIIGLYNANYAIVAPGCLIFYGLALFQASDQTFEEIRYLGLCEIGLGLIASFFPGYGLILWAFGFGVLHIVYGTLMYFRYDK